MDENDFPPVFPSSLLEERLPEVRKCHPNWITKLSLQNNNNKNSVLLNIQVNLLELGRLAVPSYCMMMWGLFQAGNPNTQQEWSRSVDLLKEKWILSNKGLHEGRTTTPFWIFYIENIQVHSKSIGCTGHLIGSHSAFCKGASHREVTGQSL